ncbi:efflux RND transporter periplasmic adaptor subunit [Lutibacter sp. HS1-25]|uniref:efflux RND transporter periplasmic adaptor subunit n=1 Tax=Lutibacter sp. HS1-25 TaxID=2485000 RepID=UPI001011DCE8|nr:efflux RND transporter periplasmic adaptor subunit [Lutibacter sp. HS1-25]RXP44492.1 efflux RND transporter periplasmic adaptor subunit [Lutibacter sp. HS1-25]
MKYFYTIIAVTFLFISCGGHDATQSLDTILEAGDITAIKSKRAEIAAKQKELGEQLLLIDEKIAELQPNKKIPLTTIITAKEDVFKHYIDLQGNVTTKSNLVIFPEYAGILKEVNVVEGQTVKKGQILARIDDGGLSQQLSQLKIQLELSKTTYERQARLWNQKIGSEMQYLQTKSSYEAQQKAIIQLEEQVAKTIIKAPFDGTIDDVITQQGSVVSPGQSQLMRIINLSNMYIETDVPESHIKTVTKNKKVIIDFPVLGITIDGEIRQAGNFINPANRTFKIEVAVPNKDNSIKPNLTAKLKINDYINPNAILIPQSIISENANGQQYVYVVQGRNGTDQGSAHRVIIETGRTQGDEIEVLAGISVGDEIIKEGARSIKDAQTVKILNL